MRMRPPFSSRSPEKFQPDQRRGLARILGHSPARISVSSFLILISIGTFLLMLPISAQGERIGFVDALFTSASASCVTGLSVFDVASRLSPFGQVVLLLLIQVGGLGMMTLSTLLILIVGKRPSISNRMIISDTFTLSQERSPAAIIRQVILYTAIIEIAGMLFFWVRFAPEFGVLKGLYYAIFHAISAFCNAGFSLFPDSFVSYRSELGTNLVLAILIILGGIGFLVLSECKNLIFSKRAIDLRRMSLHTKLVLSTSAGLVIAGTCIVALMEWNHTLAGLPFSERIMASFFESVTARTAGFNTLPTGQLANETLFFMIILMFVGASPGSCGGGIKTTTFAALSLLGISRLRGRTQLLAFRRTIPETSVSRAISILMLSILVIAVGTMLLLMTAEGASTNRGHFLEFFFETASAFGTVGLSTGITQQLTQSGKLIVATIMFVGRLGPLVVALALSASEPAPFRYAEENIMVG